MLDSTKIKFVQYLNNVHSHYHQQHMIIILVVDMENKKMQLENAPKGWKVNSTKKVYSNYLLKLYEDTLDLNGKEKIYLRGVRKDYSTVVPLSQKMKFL
jgi:hypothetical protein